MTVTTDTGTWYATNIPCSAIKNLHFVVVIFTLDRQALKGLSCFLPLLAMGNLWTRNPANSKELLTPKNLDGLEELRTLERLG